jgi:hypothetical protein
MSNGVTFHVPPEYQGQIVEVSYASTPFGVVEKTFDRSDRTTRYRIASWTGALERWWASSGPWNTTPPRARWRRLTKNERLELDIDGDDPAHHATRKTSRKTSRQLDREIGAVLAGKGQ